MDTRFRVVMDDGTPLDHEYKVLGAAVIAAAQYDGYGAQFHRLDDDGVYDPSAPLRLYSSPTHIGNNDYIAKADHAFSAMSHHQDTASAIQHVAEQQITAGLIHSRYNMRIVMLDFDTSNNLTRIDSTPVEILAYELGISASELRATYIDGVVEPVHNNLFAVPVDRSRRITEVRDLLSTDINDKTLLVVAETPANAEYFAEAHWRNEIELEEVVWNDCTISCIYPSKRLALDSQLDDETPSP